jgi:hypothetical protein
LDKNFFKITRPEDSENNFSGNDIPNKKTRYLIILMESLPRRLQANIDGEGNHIKYSPEELYICPIGLFRANI